MRDVGIIGLGQFGSFSFPSYSSVKDVHVKAVFDTNTTLLTQFSKTNQVTPYPTFESILEDSSISIIVINTQNHLHFEQIKACIQKGKHVFCEKPLTTHLANAQELFDLAHQQKVTIGVDHPLRFHPFYMQLRSLIREKHYGALKSLRVENATTEGLRDSDWFWDKQKSGGWFLTSSYHFIDLALSFLGELTFEHSYEAIHEGKTALTFAQFTGSQGAQVSVFHSLFASQETQHCLVVAEFEHATVTLNGWIPESLTTTQNGVILNTLKQHPDTTSMYLSCIRDAFGDFLSALEGKSTVVSEEGIMVALSLCVTCEQNADLTVV